MQFRINYLGPRLTQFRILASLDPDTTCEGKRQKQNVREVKSEKFNSFQNIYQSRPEQKIIITS